MIKQLKRNIQFLLVSILGITLLVIFTIFGLIEYNQINNHNNQILDSTLYNHPIDNSSVFGESRLDNNYHPSTFLAEYLPLSNQYVATSTNWNIDAQTFDQLMSAAMRHPDIQGTILKNTIQFKKDVTTSRTRIAFLDLSSTHSTIRSLVLNLILLFILSIVVLTALAWYLSKKLVKPVEDSLIKQKQFIADASHELKNPLTILSNNNTILKNNPDAIISSQLHWIEAQENEINRMSTLVHDLLYLAQGDSEHYQFEKSEVNLTTTLNQVILDFEPLYFEQNRELITKKIDPNIIIWGHQESLIKLLRLLLDNALRYSYQQTPTVITLDNHTLTISNQAETLSLEQIKHLFDRFYRVDTSRSEDGYGLGLAIAKEIADDHHAKIKVTSQNQEVTFQLQFIDTLHKGQRSPSDAHKS